ncbi:DKNYY domain-containing protein, partial [uncultured Duncaniella sp.]
MRKLFLLLALSLTLTSVSDINAQGRHDRRHRTESCKENRDDEPCHRHGRRKHRPKYVVNGGNVYFGEKVVKGATSNGFAVLKDDYAKDFWNAYYRGVKISGASSGSFTSLGDGYAKDTWEVYFDGKKIGGASC